MCISASPISSGSTLSETKMTDYISTTKRLSSVNGYARTRIAAALHAQWVEGRRQADGTFEPRIKVVEGIEYDIANLPFGRLPEKFQAANLQAARFALRHIEATHAQGDDITSDEWLELASAEQHVDWMAQNSWCTDPLLMCPYNQLTDSEKQKDRVVVNIARREYIAHLLSIFESSNFHQMDFASFACAVARAVKVMRQDVHPPSRSSPAA